MKISEMLVEVVYDIIAISYLVSIHHRNFKPKAKIKRRFMSKLSSSGVQEEYEYNEDDSVE